MEARSDVLESIEVHQRLRQNLGRVRATIAEACRRSGRQQNDVRLVAVTKYVDLEIIRALLEAGVWDLGENRVQQLVSRAGALGTSGVGLLTPQPPAATAPRWHMIGHLQRNKVRAFLRQTRILHSLDSLRLANELEKESQTHDLTADAFLEVNVAGEESKSGAPLAEVPALADAVTQCAHIRLHGLMTMAPYDADPERARPYFARLRELLEELRQRGAVGPDCVHLSMGMTIDYAVAVEEGATFVRIGSALFEGIGGADSAG